MVTIKWLKGTFNDGVALWQSIRKYNWKGLFSRIHTKWQPKPSVPSDISINEFGKQSISDVQNYEALGENGVLYGLYKSVHDNVPSEPRPRARKVVESNSNYPSRGECWIKWNGKGWTKADKFRTLSTHRNPPITYSMSLYSTNQIGSGMDVNVIPFMTLSTLFHSVADSPLVELLVQRFGDPGFMYYQCNNHEKEIPSLFWDTPYGFKILQPLDDVLRYELDDSILKLDMQDTMGYNMKALPKFGVLLGCCDGEDCVVVLHRILKNFEENPSLLYEKPELVKKLEMMLKAPAHRHRSSVMGFGVWRISREDFSILYNPVEIALVRSDKNTFELSWKKEIFPNCNLQHIYFFAQKLFEELHSSKVNSNIPPIVLPADIESWCPSEQV